MRRILVDNARRKQRQKHGGGRQRVELAEELLPFESNDSDVLAVHEALEHAVSLDVLAQAIDATKSAKPEDITKTLHSLTFTEGWAKGMTNGTVKFDESGLNIHAEPVMVQWQKNELATVWPQKYAKAKMITRSVS